MSLQKSFLFLFALLLLLGNCKNDDEFPTPTPPPGVDQTFPIVYQADPPTGKLPFPQHNPEMTAAELDALVNELFIINNYGQYQCGDTPESCYFHDGLDIVLSNGTPIFALEAGTVRANIGGDQFYRTLVIEDEDEPSYGWAYTHIYHFDELVKTGENIRKGQYLALVNFKGLDHIHLSRVRLKLGGSWTNFEDWVYLFPDDYFVLRDEDPPIIKTPLHYFENQSDRIFEHGAVDTISGAVDIVASIRDVSEYSGGSLDGGSYWGDRLCVGKIDYRILKDGVVVEEKAAFDFSKLEFVSGANRAAEVNVVFKHHLLLQPNFEQSDFNGFYSHYILTNARPDLAGRINPADHMLAWETDELDDAGLARFPNGRYEVEVTAADHSGNAQTYVDLVYVKN